MTDDANDLSAARMGDPEAFGRLYARHAAVVLALCRRRASQAEAEDACQEVFVRAFRRLDQVSGAEGFRAWLYAIARNVCAERRRSDQRRSRHQERFAMDCPAVATEIQPPQASVEHAEMLGRLDAALDRLDDRERLAIHLYYLDPNPPAAAAQALELSRTSYYRLLDHARRRLAAFLKEVQVS